jgi:hypothetical protein
MMDENEDLIIKFHKGMACCMHTLQLETTSQTSCFLLVTVVHSETKTGNGIRSHLQAVLVVDVTEGQFVQSHDFRPWISVP